MPAPKQASVTTQTVRPLGTIGKKEVASSRSVLNLEQGARPKLAIKRN